MDIEPLLSPTYARQGLPPPTALSKGARTYLIELRHPHFRQRYTLDLDEGLSYAGDLGVAGFMQGQGLGRALVAAREELCSALSAHILIDQCENGSFWKKMGYRRLGFLERLHYSTPAHPVRFSSRIKRF